MASLIGQRIDKYELVALLGRGGMAEVYRARQMLGGRVAREVALKLIDPRLALTPEFIARFERETQTLASLSHPHILKAYDFGQFENNVYLVMELLPGGNLAEAIRQGPLPLDVIAGLLDQIAGALDYAHSKGVVHRDLKPHNVLLDESGNAFLTDFGIAKLISETAVLTHSGAAIGTPSYMAPEQWIGGPIDARTDTYAFGVMLFEMLTRRVPFQGDTPYRVMHMHTDEPPPLAVPLRPDLPPTIDQVVHKALAKNPADRYQSATALVKDFKAALMGGAVSAPPLSSRPSAIVPLNAQQLHDPTSLPIVPTPALAQRRINPRIGILAAVLAVLIIVIGGIGLGLALSGQFKPAATPAINPTVPAAILPTQALVVILATNTEIPPTPTNVPLPAVQATNTRIPTFTPIPPTATHTPTFIPSRPPNTPTHTFTPIPPTATHTPTYTLTPTPSTAPRTSTTVPPTSLPPTNTAVPPTPVPTNTPIPPTNTPTNTPMPPTPIPTDTPIPPTNTPTNTPMPTYTPSPTETSVPSSAILYQEKFNGKTVKDWTDYNGTWSINQDTDGTTFWRGTGPTNYPQSWYSASKSQNWTNYAWEFKARFPSAASQDSTLFMCFRSDQGSRFYAFVANTSPWSHIARFDGKEYKVLQQIDPSHYFFKDRWYLMRIEAQGDKLRWFIDDILYATISDPTFKSGGIGFYMGGNDIVDIAAMRVWKLSQ